jgi:hypothetical protein
MKRSRASNRHARIRNPQSAIRNLPPRHFFQQCRVGLGAMALGSLLAGDGNAAESADPLAARQPHFTPRAKNVIFLFMAGGPSQMDLFTPKPKLQELGGQVIPQSFVANKRLRSSRGTPSCWAPTAGSNFAARAADDFQCCHLRQSPTTFAPCGR